MKNFKSFNHRFCCAREFEDFITMFDRRCPFMIFYSQDKISLTFLSISYICSFNNSNLFDYALGFVKSYFKTSAQTTANLQLACDEFTKTCFKCFPNDYL